MLSSQLSLVMKWAADKGHHSSSTQRAYALAGRTFLAWLEHAKGSNAQLVDVTDRDVLAYMTYLGNPVVPIPWDVYHQYGFVAPPAIRPLKQATISQLVSVLSCLYSALPEYAQQAGYAIPSVNPFKRLTLNKSRSPRFMVGQVFSPAQWHAAFQILLNGMDNAMGRRTMWIFLLIYYTFLRTGQISRLNMADFIQLPNSEWGLRIKTSNLGTQIIAVVPNLVDSLIKYRTSNGLSPFPKLNETGPAVIPIRAHDEWGVTSHIVHRSLKIAFIECAQIYPIYSNVFNRATPAWIRNTGMTTALTTYNIAERYVRRQACLTRTQLDFYVLDEDALFDAFQNFGPPSNIAGY
jgi:hypothetical protein